MRRLVPAAAALLALVACAADGGDGGAAVPCPALSGPATPTEVLRVPDRSAFDPDVHATPDGLVAYVGSVIMGDGGTYRAESADGLTWTTPVRVLDDWGSALFLPTGVRFYYGRWEDRGIEPYRRIGTASSADGVTFLDEGIVWGGSGELGEDGLPLEHELHRPVAWFDGTRVHLYFTALGDRAQEDVGFGVASVGHAVAEDGVTFEPAPWPFPARPCVAPPVGWDTYESLGIVAAVRPSCATCASEGISLVLSGRLCDGTVGTFLTHSTDGETFSPPSPLELPQGGGTLLVAGTEGLYLHGFYDGSNSAILAQAITLPGAALTCR